MAEDRTDIRNDDDLKLLVHQFYSRVQEDERLGYIFNDVAQVDWSYHLPRMVDFWSNLIFQTGRYDGKPFRQHLPLPIKQDDFSRWFGLFTDTVDQLFSGPRADYAKDMALRIARSFAVRMAQEDEKARAEA